LPTSPISPGILVFNLQTNYWKAEFFLSRSTRCPEENITLNVSGLFIQGQSSRKSGFRNLKLNGSTYQKAV